MRDAQHAAYEAYLQDLAKRLNLADWEVTLSRDRADEGMLACVHVMDVEDYAHVRLWWPEFFDKPPEEQREILVHELLHMRLDRVQRTMVQLAEQWSENSAYQYAREAHRREVEIVAQHLARLLAPSLPLPPKVRE